MSEVRWGTQGRPHWENGVLGVCQEDLIAQVAVESALTEVRVELVAPGESARIIHALDAVEPRVHVEGKGTDFPGFLGPPETVGDGGWHALRGLAVITSGLIGLHEGLVEMTGPGAALCPLSQTWNLVITAEPALSASPVEYESSLRRASMQLAVYLADATRGQTPDEVEVYTLEPADPDLPRVGYIYFVQAQGQTRDTFLYGTTASPLIPTMLHPNEALAGAIVSGDFVIVSQKNPTYFHQNNPMIRELYRRHGRDLAFAGVTVANLHSTMADKERTASFAAKLAKLGGWQGAVVSKEGGGNAYTDIMLVCRALEREGVRTVLITNELAGVDGDQPSVTEMVAEANAIISTGNNEEIVNLPAVKRVVGGNALRDGTDAHGPFAAPLGLIYCATNQMGGVRLTAAAY